MERARYLTSPSYPGHPSQNVVTVRLAARDTQQRRRRQARFTSGAGLSWLSLSLKKTDQTNAPSTGW